MRKDNDCCKAAYRQVRLDMFFERIDSVLRQLKQYQRRRNNRRTARILERAGML